MRLPEMDDAESAYASIPGGPELLAWFGRVPSFHDAEIVRLDLNRRAASTLSIHAWNTTDRVDERGYFVLDRHAVVTFALEDVLDLQLGGFSHQNVIGYLHLRRAPDRPDRRPYMWDPAPDDWEVELEPCYGMDGHIRCRRISISFIPGMPSDFREWSR
jgi:hypothetical protein